MRTLQEKYNGIQEGKFSKDHFLVEARMQHPHLVTRFNGYDDAVQILKNKGMIQEGIHDKDILYSPHTNVQSLERSPEQLGKEADGRSENMLRMKYSKQIQDPNISNDELRYLLSGKGVKGFGGTPNAINKIIANRNSNESVAKEGKHTYDFSKYTNNDLAHVIIDKSRYEGTEEEVQAAKEELAKRKENLKENYKEFTSQEKAKEGKAKEEKLGASKNLKIGDKVKVSAAAAKKLKLDPEKEYTIKGFKEQGKGSLKSVDVLFAGNDSVNIDHVKKSIKESGGHANFGSIAFSGTKPEKEEPKEGEVQLKTLNPDDKFTFPGHDKVQYKVKTVYKDGTVTVGYPDGGGHMEYDGNKFVKPLNEARLTKNSLTDYRYKPTNDMDKYPYEQILRGLRVELEGLGITATPTPEEYKKALAKVLKNLEKDEIFYTNQLAGVSKKVDLHDKMVDATAKNTVDTFNGMKKAELKEGIKNLLKNILSEDLEDYERASRAIEFGVPEEEEYELKADDEEEEDEIDYDDENFSDPLIDGDEDDIFESVSLKDLLN